MVRVARATAGVWVGVAVLALGSGCANPEKMRLAELEQANTRLVGDLNDLQSQLEAARREADEARRQAEALAAAQATTPAETATEPATDSNVPEGWQGGPGRAMIAVPGEVLFDPGKATLKGNAQAVLKRIAETIRERFADREVYVFGHTDDQPIKHSKWRDNRELSCERAMSVVRHLESQGLSPKKLVACGAGEHRPRVPNVDAAGQARNRRVEIFAVESEPLIKTQP